MKLLRIRLIFLIWMGVWGSAQSAVITLDQTNRGWIDERGWCTGHCTNAFGNYFTGYTSDHVYRSFFIFDLSAVTEFIQSAEFSFTSNSLQASYEIFDISSAFSLFSNTYDPFDPIGLSLFDDLGSGVSYGQNSFINSGSIDSIMTAVLNTSAISAINNSRGGLFGFGVTILNPPTGGSIGSGSGGSGNFTQLVLNTGTPTNNVSAPPSWAMFSVGLAFVFAHRRTRL